jgi:hypothetical protein
MTYTASSGRPEIIAAPGFKLGPAAYRIDDAPAAADSGRPDEPTGAGKA